MNKKVILVAVLLSTLLFTGVAGTTLVHLGKANPVMRDWIYYGTRVPDKNTSPPAISIFSPKNNTVNGADTVFLSLNVSVGNSITAEDCVLDKIFCETDWQSNPISVYEYGVPFYPGVTRSISEFSEIIDLTGVPDGNHTIKVYAVESGKYDTGRTKMYLDGNMLIVAHYYYRFEITGFSLVRFIVDTTPPKISVLSIENKAYNITGVDLNFTLSELVSEVTYSLDGQENVTVAGNTTLTGLASGGHNVTVYAWDTAGNVGASETTTFTIAEPEPETFAVAPVVVASAASVAAVSAALLIYFRKRRH